ncbi:MAG: hypothetical protein DGJ47_000182 [Rickettsiaceae bacterium]
MQKVSFQELISKLQKYWQDQGCAILQPYDMEMGAGTFHPATVLRALGKKPWNVVYVQPSRRPTDSRYGKHPNRMQYFYQLQVVLKPSPNNMQELYLKSLEHIGIDLKKHDIRFVEDDWESPTIGAAGLGWEVWCNGMEVSQFTYMQQIAGIDCRPVAGEITYGLERIALYLQGIDNAKDLDWNGQTGEKALTYGQVIDQAEYQFSKYNIEFADTEILLQQFKDAEKQCSILVNANLAMPAYEQCIKASHLFNLLCARGVVSVTERASYISRIRNLAKISCEKWVQMQEQQQEV